MKIFVNKKQDTLAYLIDGKYYNFYLSPHVQYHAQPLGEQTLKRMYCTSDSMKPYSREITLSQLQEMFK
jgi:hypothetical protein